MARDVASASVAASVSSAFIRSSGAKACPLTMPMAAIVPRTSGLIASIGSSWMISFRFSKYEKSLGKTVLKALFDMLTNSVAAGFAASFSG